MENSLPKIDEHKYGYSKVFNGEVKNENPKTEVRLLQYDGQSGDKKKVTCSPSCCPSLKDEDRLVCIFGRFRRRVNDYFRNCLKRGHTVGEALLPRRPHGCDSRRINERGGDRPVFPRLSTSLCEKCDKKYESIDKR
jgi:hypothetical protein